MADSTPPGTPLEVGQQFAADVATKLATLNPTVREKVIDIKVQEEITKRTDMVMKGLSKLDELEKAAQKIKADHVIKDVEGKVIQEGYTDAKLKEKNKADQAVKQMREALSKALAEANYEPLKKALGGGGGGGDKPNSNEQ